MKYIKKFDETNSDDILEVLIKLEELKKRLMRGSRTIINILTESPLTYEYISPSGFSETIEISNDLSMSWLSANPGKYTTAYYAPESLSFNNTESIINFLEKRYWQVNWDFSNIKKTNKPKRYYTFDKNDEIPNSWR